MLLESITLASYDEDMDNLHPPEKSASRLEMGIFTEHLLNNDLIAAMVARSAEQAETTKKWHVRTGDPSILVLDDGQYTAGVRMSYERSKKNRHKYVYTDFFIINPEDGSHTPTQTLLDATSWFNQRAANAYIEEAWREWLNEMHSFAAKVSKNNGGDRIYSAEYTGNLSFGTTDAPPGYIEITLPIL